MKKMTVYPSKIKGSVKISGSKNAALPIIAASLVASKRTILKNVPNISDINNMIKILNKIGCGTKFNNNKLFIESKVEKCELLFDEVKAFRASYYLMSVFLILFNEVTICYPGGCSIGSRPIDFHLEGFKSAGCEVSCECDKVSIKANKLSPFIYRMPKKSMGATVNLMILATKLNGKSIIENASTEPEIDNLISFLNKGSAFIYRFKGDIIIHGNTITRQIIVDEIIPDRIEAFTYICIGLNSDKLKIKRINPDHLKNSIKSLVKSGANIKIGKNKVIVKRSNLNNIHITSGDYPMLSTDQMPLLYPLFIRNNEQSIFTEGIFESRFDVCKELIKTGANINICGQKIYINKAKEIKGAVMVAKDLRCAAALLVEATINQDSTIHNLEYLERGYDDVYKKLKKIALNFTIDEM